MYKPVEKPSGVGCARVQRKAQVLTCLYDQCHPETGAVKANEGEWAGWMSTLQVAKACGLSSSPHFRALLMELYAEGMVLVVQATHRANINKHMWGIAENTRWSREWIGVFDAYLSENWAERLSDTAAE